MHPNKIVLLLVFIFFSPVWLHAQSADEIINKYVVFIGGEKNWKKIKTLTTSGKYNYGGQEFPFRSYAKAPNLYKFIVPLEGKYYAQAFDGEKGWKIDAFKNETTPTILTGNPARSMANEADVELSDPFVDYKRKGHTISLAGKDQVEGKDCIGVELIRANGGGAETYYFDAATGVLVMKLSPSKNSELQGTMLNIFYSDYRDVNGIKIPFKVISKSNDQLILEATTEKAEVNSKMDDRIFQAP
jgi:hypothetical protein